MTTQVIFKIEKKLKEQAMKKAQSKGIALASMLKFATKAFVEGRLDVGLVGTEIFNAKTRREMEKISRDIKLGKNLSPAFNNVKDAMAYLKSS